MEDAAELVPHGAISLIGGFMVAGCISRAIASHIGLHPETLQKMIASDFSLLLAELDL